MAKFKLRPHCKIQTNIPQEEVLDLIRVKLLDEKDGSTTILVGKNDFSVNSNNH